MAFAERTLIEQLSFTAVPEILWVLSVHQVQVNLL